MADEARLLVTPGGVIKHLYDPNKLEIDSVVRFLIDLNSALDQSTRPSNSTSKLVWVPDDQHNPGQDYKAILTYDYRQSKEKTHPSNINYLYLTDVAALLDEVKQWLERNSSTVTSSVPAVYNMVRTIRNNELLDRVRITNRQELQTENGVALADGDGYNEKALGPDEGFNLINEYGAYDRLLEIAHTLLVAAILYEKIITGEISVEIGSIQQLISEISKSSSDPIKNWGTIQLFAKLLAES